MAFLLATGYFLLKAIWPTATDSIHVQPQLTWLLELSALALNYFAFKSGFGLGIGLFFTTILGATYYHSRTKITAERTLTSVGILASLAFAWRAN